MDFMTRLLARPGDTAQSVFDRPHSAAANGERRDALIDNKKGGHEDAAIASAIFPQQHQRSGNQRASMASHSKASLKSITSDPRQRLAKLMSTASLNTGNNIKVGATRGDAKNGGRSGVRNAMQEATTPKNSSSVFSNDEATNHRQFQDSYGNIFDQLTELMSKDQDDDDFDRNSYGEEIMHSLSTPYNDKNGKRMAARVDDSMGSSEGLLTPSPYYENRKQETERKQHEEQRRMDELFHGVEYDNGGGLKVDDDNDDGLIGRSLFAGNIQHVAAVDGGQRYSNPNGDNDWAISSSGLGNGQDDLRESHHQPTSFRQTSQMEHMNSSAELGNATQNQENFPSYSGVDNRKQQLNGSNHYEQSTAQSNAQMEQLAPRQYSGNAGKEYHINNQVPAHSLNSNNNPLEALQNHDRSDDDGSSSMETDGSMGLPVGRVHEDHAKEVNSVRTKDMVDDFILGEPEQKHHHSHEELQLLRADEHGIAIEYAGTNDGLPFDTRQQVHADGDGQADRFMPAEEERRKPQHQDQDWYQEDSHQEQLRRKPMHQGQGRREEVYHGSKRNGTAEWNGGSNKPADDAVVRKQPPYPETEFHRFSNPNSGNCLPSSASDQKEEYKSHHDKAATMPNTDQTVNLRQHQPNYYSTQGHVSYGNEIAPARSYSVNDNESDNGQHRRVQMGQSARSQRTDTSTQNHNFRDGNDIAPYSYEEQPNCEKSNNQTEPHRDGNSSQGHDMKDAIQSLSCNPSQSFEAKPGDEKLNHNRSSTEPDSAKGIPEGLFHDNRVDEDNDVMFQQQQQKQNEYHQQLDVSQNGIDGKDAWSSRHHPVDARSLRHTEMEGRQPDISDNHSISFSPLRREKRHGGVECDGIRKKIHPTPNVEPSLPTEIERPCPSNPANIDQHNSSLSQWNERDFEKPHHKHTTESNGQDGKQHQDQGLVEKWHKIDRDQAISANGHPVNDPTEVKYQNPPNSDKMKNGNMSSSSLQAGNQPTNSHMQKHAESHFQVEEMESHLVNPTQDQPSITSGMSASTSRSCPVFTNLKGVLRGEHSRRMAGEDEILPQHSSLGNGVSRANASVFVQKPNTLAPLDRLQSVDSMDSEPLVSSKGHATFFCDTPKADGSGQLAPIYSVEVPKTPESPSFAMFDTFKEELDTLVTDLISPFGPNGAERKYIPTAHNVPEKSFRDHMNVATNSDDGSTSVEERQIDTQRSVLEGQIASLKAKVHSLHGEKTISEEFLQKMQSIINGKDGENLIPIDLPSSWPLAYKTFEDANRKRQSLLVSLESRLDLSLAESVKLATELEHAGGMVTELSQAMDHAQKDLHEARETTNSQAQVSSGLELKIEGLKEQLEDSREKNNSSCVFFNQLDALLSIGNSEVPIYDEENYIARLDKIKLLQSRLQTGLEKLDESLEREQSAKAIICDLKSKVKELENHTRESHESSSLMEAKIVQTEKLAEAAISANEALAKKVADIQDKLARSRNDHKALLVTHNSGLENNKKIFAEYEETKSLIAERDVAISALKSSYDTCHEEKIQLQEQLASIRTKTVFVMKQRIEGLKLDYTRRLEDFKASHLLEQENNEEASRLKLELEYKEAENSNFRRRMEQIEKSTSLKLQNAEEKLSQVQEELTSANIDSSNQKEENNAMKNELEHLRSLMDIAEESVGELNWLKEENKRLNDMIRSQNDQESHISSVHVPFEIRSKRLANDNSLYNEDGHFVHERISALMRENEQNNISMRTLQSENVALKGSIQECNSTIQLMHSGMNDLKAITTGGVSKLQMREKSLLDEKRKDRDAMAEMEKKLGNANKLIRSLRPSNSLYYDAQGAGTFVNPNVIPPPSINRLETPQGNRGAYYKVDNHATPSAVSWNERNFVAELSTEKELRFKAEEIAAGVLANSKAALEERDTEISKLRSQLFNLSTQRYNGNR